ncbi:MAG: cupin-like domain-containing protein [Nitrospira sp.]|nr:cupin-like domain-containing protein [Nitrospira sp.]
MIRINAEQIQNSRLAVGKDSIPLGCVPFIVEGYASQWPALTHWVPETLGNQYGDYQVKCFFAEKTQSTFLQQVNRHKTLQFKDFLALVFSNNPEDAHQYYLRIDTTHPLFDQLAKDFLIPNWLTHYNPHATGIWIGQKGNITPFHHDWWHGFLAQIAGEKQFHLVHPLEGALLQQEWPSESTYDLAPAPVFSLSDLKASQLETYCEGILKPGEILYIPPYWYHQIDTLDNGNISIPIRYDTTMTPEVPLLQFSQNSGLRAITNHQIKDKEELIGLLITNRELFQEKEKAFIEAFIKTRNPSLTLDGIIEKLEGTPSRFIKINCP